MQKIAVINITNQSCCALADTAAEAALPLGAGMRGVPAGRIEALGFRIKPVMVTVHVLPDSSFVPSGAEQGALFN